MIGEVMTVSFGASIPYPDGAIATSLLVPVTLAVVARRYTPVVAPISSIVIGFFQGFAHASEVPQSIDALVFGFGFVCTSAMLITAGIFMTYLFESRRELWRTRALASRRSWR